MAEQGDPFAQLREDMAAALATLESSLSSLPAVEHKVFVRPDDILVFDRDDSNLDLELTRLRNIFENISAMSHEIFTTLKAWNVTGQRSHSAQRKAVTMRDVADQMVKILNGEHLTQSITWLADGEDDKAVRVEEEPSHHLCSADRAAVVDESNRIKLDALATEQQLLEAYVYQQVKKVRDRLHGGGEITTWEAQKALADQLTYAMDVISGHKPVPTREEQ